MRLINIVIFYFCFSLILWGCVAGGIVYEELCKKCDVERQKYECVRFLSECFKNTCEGKGFRNLNEWQKVCRTLWNLEYIGWASSTEFFDDDNLENGSDLMYGKWVGAFGEGEVFARMKKEIF